jgi:hypothetical protein
MWCTTVIEGKSRLVGFKSLQGKYRLVDFKSLNTLPR